MTDEDLRDRLGRLDPARRLDVAAFIESRTAHDIRERAMQTTSEPTVENRPRPVLAVVASVVTLAVVVGGAALAARENGPTAPDRAPTTLALSVPDGTAVNSCIAFDVAFLRDMPVAFAGTVTDVAEGSVTLDVDHWYKGGDAGVVTVANPAGASVALDGVEFTDGDRFLVTATDGVVNGCGFSGPATAELEHAFDEAFGAA